MAKVFIEETTLTAIGDAIRGKEGTTALVPVNDMATRITSLQTGSNPVIKSLEITSNGTYTATDCDGYSPITVNVPQDGAPTNEELVVTGNCTYRFANNGWNWVIEKHGNRIIAKDITECESMFKDCSNLEAIPFEKIECAEISGYHPPKITRMFEGCKKIKRLPDVYANNAKATTTVSVQSMFNGCYELEELPYIYYVRPGAFSYMCGSCYRLRTIPEDWMDTWYLDFQIETSPSANMFYCCYSLRSIPDKIMKTIRHKNNSSYNCMYVQMFNGCYALDEVKGLFVNEATLTSNCFNSTFSNLHRAKNITFETNEDGTPIATEWKSQTIDLSTNVGWSGPGSNSDFYILNYNSGITADKRMYGDTYQALKNDPDAYATAPNWSRYDHDSAVRTINSLPDTSAYLAANGGTNTIKFDADLGSETDAGAISTLTEEEIAVATAKGWTVTLV